MIILSAPIEGKLKLFVLRFCKLKLKQLIFSEQFVIVIFFFLNGCHEKNVGFQSLHFDSISSTEMKNWKEMVA